MNILEKIFKQKQKFVEEKKSIIPTKLLEQSIYFDTPSISLKEYILREDKLGIIAEFKRKSPSKQAINLYANVEKVSIGYMQAGASAVSVLTDTEFFGGKNEDLRTVRKFNYCPILRKDFIFDEYQIVEAKSIGADAILLIAEMLEETQIKQLSQFAQSLGLEVLMEVHSRDELSKTNDFIDLIGINNRNLKTFKVDTQTTLDILPFISNEKVKISESGISNAQTVAHLKEQGCDGFLIGEHFMKDAQPHKKCASFIKEVERIIFNKKVNI